MIPSSDSWHTLTILTAIGYSDYSGYVKSATIKSTRPGYLPRPRDLRRDHPSFLGINIHLSQRVFCGWLIFKSPPQICACCVRKSRLENHGEPWVFFKMDFRDLEELVFRPFPSFIEPIFQYWLYQQNT